MYADIDIQNPMKNRWYFLRNFDKKYFNPNYAANDLPDC